MSRKDDPRYGNGGDVWCDDCPLSDDDGASIRNLCVAYGYDCPTRETYQDAVRFAEEYREEGR